MKKSKKIISFIIPSTLILSAASTLSCVIPNNNSNDSNDPSKNKENENPNQNKMSEKEKSDSQGKISNPELSPETPQKNGDGNGNNSGDKKENDKQIERRNESYYWTSSLTEMPKPLFTEGKAADKFVGYVLNIGALEINNRVISTEEANKRFEEAKKQWEISQNDFLAYDASYRQKYGKTISTDKISYFNYAGSHYDEREEIARTYISFEFWIEDLHYFSYQRWNTKDFKNLSEKDKNFISDLNKDVWNDFVLSKKEHHKAFNFNNMRRFLADYFNLIDLLKRDLKLSDRALNEQFSEETRNVLKTLMKKTFQFLEKTRGIFLEFKNGKKFFFDLADFASEYDPAWRFNRMIKLLNEFLMPLAIATNTYAIDEIEFWDKTYFGYEKERLWYPKYLFNKWDNANGQRVGELKEYKSRDEAINAWKRFVADNVGLDIYFGDIDKKEN
ncbi:hypothetical protein [Mycoplasma phocoeninasale]|uniref:hypothetical protein n=1 Tax=Mycoplasma phocoeninasale TaxID=2726117 RepID=UPI001966E3BB|nr:hypothetical protein [Mycoplasma phocoeninasale]MBN0970764.1 hypothetical protein [Mycoplasma phocoeninasale]